MEKALIPVPEFLEQYSISRTSFYREVKAGRLTLTKRGARSMVAREDAHAWKEALRTQSLRHA